MIFNLCFFAGIFVIGFIIFYLINLRRVKKKKFNKIKEANYLIGRFKLDKQKINYNKLIIFISLVNSFIIAFVCTIISIIPLELIWKMLIGFVMLFIMIVLIYELMGKICLKKGWGKNAGIKSQKNRK